MLVSIALGTYEDRQSSTILRPFYLGLFFIRPGFSDPHRPLAKKWCPNRPEPWKSGTVQACIVSNSHYNADVAESK